MRPKLVLFSLIFIFVSVTLTDASRFDYRRGPFISLGAGANGIAALNFGTSNAQDGDAVVWPRVSLRFGYGVNERRLYYVRFAVPSGLGLGLGYIYFPKNYERFYTFGSIGTIMLPIPISDESEQYTSGIPLIGEPSVNITGGIGYQWMHHSTIEFLLTYDRSFRVLDQLYPYTDALHFTSISIMIRGFLW